MGPWAHGPHGPMGPMGPHGPHGPHGGGIWGGMGEGLGGGIEQAALGIVLFLLYEMLYFNELYPTSSFVGAQT